MMNLKEHKKEVDAAYAAAVAMGQDPADIEVHMQVQDQETDEVFWTESEQRIDVIYDNNGQASGCVIVVWGKLAGWDAGARGVTAAKDNHDRFLDSGHALWVQGEFIDGEKFSHITDDVKRQWARDESCRVRPYRKENAIAFCSTPEVAAWIVARLNTAAVLEGEKRKRLAEEGAKEVEYIVVGRYEKSQNTFKDPVQAKEHASNRNAPHNGSAFGVFVIGEEWE